MNRKVIPSVNILHHVIVGCVTEVSEDSKVLVTRHVRNLSMTGLPSVTKWHTQSAHSKLQFEFMFESMRLRSLGKDEDCIEKKKHYCLGTNPVCSGKVMKAKTPTFSCMANC